MSKKNTIQTIMLNSRVLRNYSVQRRLLLHVLGSVCLENLGGSCLHSEGSWRMGVPSLEQPAYRNIILGDQTFCNLIFAKFLQRKNVLFFKDFQYKDLSFLLNRNINSLVYRD